MRSTIEKIQRDKIELLRILGHPLRIEILEQLESGVKCVSDLEEFLETSQPNISQHLGLLRRAGLIDYYMDGRLRCYFLVDPMVPDLLELMRKQYKEDLEAPTCCPVTKTGKYPGSRRP